MAIAVALVALTAFVPVVGACCVAKPATSMSSMHALMPCCAETCKLTKDTSRTDHDFTLTAPAPTLSLTGVVPVVDRPITIASALEIQPAAFTSPPSFLSHHQFRI